jgi:hypothetical protein
VQHTTRASEAPCRGCRRPLLYAWDEGLLVKADAVELDDVVAAALRGAGHRVYALTHGRHLVLETPRRAGTLRLVLSRHARHVCTAPEKRALLVQEQLELFDLDGGRR